MRTSLRMARLFMSLAALSLLSACGHIAGSGFLRSILEPAVGEPKFNGIQLVEVTGPVARQLAARQSTRLFSETLGSKALDTERIQPGDVIEVSVWEAPPATLFTGGFDAKGVTTAARVTTFPEQLVTTEGSINIPFAGQIPARGQMTSQIEAEIVKRLRSLANQPQVLVRRTRNLSSDVTVVGDVATSTRLPLTPRGEKLLDAIAAAGGVRQPINRTTIQVTRGKAVHALPLETIIRDPSQNVLLQPGDVVTALFQPLSFIALGATGRNEEINFEAQGISLSQALARAGGLNDARADAQGVFVFRFEPGDALDWPRKPVATTPEGLVPVVYRLNLNDPASFLVAQSFPIRNKDVLYVSNASFAELQKFLTLVATVLNPLATIRILND